MRARLRSFCLVAAVLTALLLILHPTESPYLRLLWQGDEHAAHLERTAAAAAYRRAAAVYPDAPTPYLRLARLYLDWGRLDECLLLLAGAADRGAEEVALERLSTEVALARSDWGAAIEHGRRWLTLTSDSGDARPALRALGRAYLESHAWAAAAREYLALVRAAPDDAAAQETLGLLLLPTDPVAAFVHLRAAGSDRAARYLHLSAAGGDPAYRNTLTGKALCEEDEWALAVLHLERALLLWPNYADAHAYLGYALTRSGFLPQAAAHLSRAVALAPRSVIVHSFLGMYHERQGDLAAARAEYERAYDLDPSNPAACVSLGRVWTAAGRYDVAEIWLQEAVTLQPDDPDLWLILAHFYLDNQLFVAERGGAAVERLLALRPDDATAHDMRGWAAFLIGDYETAAVHLRLAVALDPDLAAAYYHLGRLLAAQGQVQAAREAFIRAQDLSPAYISGRAAEHRETRRAPA